MKKIFATLTTALLLLSAALVGCTRDGRSPHNPNNKRGDNSRTEAKDLLIEEVYYFGNYHHAITANEKAAGKKANWKQGGETQYNKYIRITNPTKKDISLDGMGIAISLYRPETKPDFSDAVAPTVYNDSLAISKLYLFPKGESKNTLKPGDTRIIATAAIDPTEAEKKRALEWEEQDLDFSALLDLTGADYELNDKNPAVPNLTPFFDLSAFIQGDYDAEDFDPFDFPSSTGIALVRLGTTDEELLREIMAVNPKSRKTDKKGKYTRPTPYKSKHNPYADYHWALFLPNDWITDFVSISAKDNAKWVVNAKLDQSSNGVNQNAADEKVNAAGNYDAWGKYAALSLTRKNDGNKIVDTNDSNKDFEIKAASLTKKK